MKRAPLREWLATMWDDEVCEKLPQLMMNCYPCIRDEVWATMERALLRDEEEKRCDGAGEDVAARVRAAVATTINDHADDVYANRNTHVDPCLRSLAKNEANARTDEMSVRCYRALLPPDTQFTTSRRRLMSRRINNRAGHFTDTRDRSLTLLWCVVDDAPDDAPGTTMTAQYVGVLEPDGTTSYDDLLDDAFTYIVDDMYTFEWGVVVATGGGWWEKDAQCVHILPLMVAWCARHLAEAWVYVDSLRRYRLCCADVGNGNGNCNGNDGNNDVNVTIRIVACEMSNNQVRTDCGWNDYDPFERRLRFLTLNDDDRDDHVILYSDDDDDDYVTNTLDRNIDFVAVWARHERDAVIRDAHMRIPRDVVNIVCIYSHE
jgi:hypothetical protein